MLQTFLAVFNVRLELGETIDKLLVFINALFAVLMIVGIVNDPTTAGLTDSTRALGITNLAKIKLRKEALGLPFIL